MDIPFQKMHGLGNDFVVLDVRQSPPWQTQLQPALLRAMADRRTGIGCDQVIILKNTPDADIFMQIFNADGSEAGACGNAARCIGTALLAVAGQECLTIKTIDQPLAVRRHESGQAAVCFGSPRYSWQQIPLAKEMLTNPLPVIVPELPQPYAVSMGNPHCVFFVEDKVAAEGVITHGPVIENHPWFPARTNVEFATILNAQQIRMRVWERGAGRTTACGTGACAVASLAWQLGLLPEELEIICDGGSLFVSRDSQKQLWLRGATAQPFTGVYHVN